MKFTACFIIGCLIAALTGCTSHQGELMFHPAASTKAPVYESFPAAYISSNKMGEYDLVLVEDTLRGVAVKNKKGPLHPVKQPPLQQAMCIHIFWKPTQGAMIRESSVTNAIVDWYVFGPERLAPDMLHYTGAAFVKLDAKGNVAWVVIGDGEIAPSEHRGDMKDPVGHARLTGEVTAIRNDGRVQELLQSVKDRIAGNERVWTEAANDLRPADR